MGRMPAVDVSGAWWVIRRAVHSVGAVQHRPVKKCRILEDLFLGVGASVVGTRAPLVM
jgi:hypothetical protein